MASNLLEKAKIFFFFFAGLTHAPIRRVLLRSKIDPGLPDRRPNDQTLLSRKTR